MDDCVKFGAGSFTVWSKKDSSLENPSSTKHIERKQITIDLRMLKKMLWTALLAAGCVAATAFSGAPKVEKPVFPNPNGYVTLLGDLHQHTVFSDGLVWPTTRVYEAKREGLDVIAITDHIEYTPHKQDIPVKHGRSCAIAQAYGKQLGIMVIPGLEITRGSQNSATNPIKHINCLFLTNFNALAVPDMKDAVYAAADQGAFIFWNHPAWAQIGHKSVWYPEMDEFLEKGILKGFEVTNGRDYQPNVIEWCQTHKVAMLGNTDIHNAIIYSAHANPGEHRTMTLIFAKERSLDSVKEALFAGRTAVYCITEEGDKLIGNEEWLQPIFFKGVTYEPQLEPGQEWLNKPVPVLVKNSLPFDVVLKRTAQDNIKAPANVTIPARGTTTVKVTPQAGNYSVTYEAENFQIAKDKKLSITVQ